MKIVIFCGGFGTRMWPASRKSNPKQFYPLIGGKSFFQLTVSRFTKVFSPEDIIVSTEQNYIEFVKSQAPEIPVENIIAEPERKDNLAAIGLATAIVQKRFPGEVMMASWSDHFIGDEDEFLKAVKAASDYAKESGLVVSVNEKPTYPSISNEWVKTGNEIKTVDGYSILAIEQTIKRPDLETAKQLFSSEGYLINTGYRAWRSDVMLEYYREFQPLMYEGLSRIAESYGTDLWNDTLKTEYSKFIKESVEFGIFVNLSSDKSATIASNFGWKDAGTWEFFYKALDKDALGNVTEGGVLTTVIDSQNNLIIGTKGKVVSIIGLSGIAVVETEDGVLVTKLENSDKVKEVFGVLEKEHPEFVE